jgi:hypothetical protein
MSLKTTPKWMKVLAVLSAILLGATLSLSLVAYNLEHQFFNPEVYKNALISQNFCERLPEVITQQILASNTAQHQGNFLELLINSMEPVQLQSMVESVIPCQLMEKVAFAGIDQFFSQINQGTNQQGLLLGSLKQSLQDNSTSIVDNFLSSQPDCSAAQLLQIGANALLGQSNQGASILCNPPSALREVITAPLALLFDSAIQGLPDQIPFSKDIRTLINTLQVTRFLLNWSFLIPLIFLGLTTAFAVRTWRALLQWWGYPFLSAGLITLLISLMVSPLIYASLTYLLLPRFFPALVPEVIKLFSDMFASTVQGITRPIQIQSLLLSLGGLVMVLGEKLTRKK